MLVARNVGNLLQRALFQLLDGAISSTVEIEGEITVTRVNLYDHVGDDAEYPAIHMQGYSGTVDMTKTSVIQNISMDFGIWSKHSGQQEVSDIIDRLMTILSVADIDLTPHGFYVIDQYVSSYRSDPESDWGYYGQVTVDFQVQNLQPIR